MSSATRVAKRRAERARAADGEVAQALARLTTIADKLAAQRARGVPEAELVALYNERRRAMGAARGAGLTIDEVAEWAGVTPRTVLRATKPSERARLKRERSAPQSRRAHRRQLDGPISVASSTARSQPRQTCQGCRRVRPVRSVRGVSLCVDCQLDVDLATRPAPPPSAGDLS